MSETLKIDRIGHMGDGLAESDGRTIAVRFAAPGDLIEPDGEGGWRLSEYGANRAEPPCRHFEVCGGCSLQHVSQGAYLAAKRDWVVEGLARQGLTGIDVREVLPVGAGARRRAAFSVKWEGARAALGFHEARGARVVPVEMCPVLNPALVGVLPALGELSARFVRRGDDARVLLALLDNGIDVAFESSDAGPRAPVDHAVTEELRRLRIIRLAWNGEVLSETERPVLTFSGRSVMPPPGAFFQATAEAEVALSLGVVTHLAEAHRIADLYAGLGTFTFALAQAGHSEISAFEGDEGAVRSLTNVARTGEGSGVTGQVRDLARRPLTMKELDRFDGAVLNPPRGGAETQAANLAQSSVSRVAYVSCNPATFARDARRLVDGGLALDFVQPVDQFLWSAQLELVAGFSRAPQKKKRPFHPRRKRSSVS